MNHTPDPESAPRTPRKYDKIGALWPKHDKEGRPYFGGKGTGLLEGRFIIVRAVTVQYTNGPAYDVLASEPDTETPNDQNS
jgi:hypothetical protein